MSWLVANINRLMFVSGALTLTMVYAAIAPEAALRSTFGESLSGPVARVPAVRPLTLVVAGTSKAIFITLVLVYGRQFLAYQAGVAVVVDAIWVALFAVYLVAARRAPTAKLNVAAAKTL